MRKLILVLALTLVIGASFVALKHSPVFAQSAEEVVKRKAALEAELKDVEKQIAEQTILLNKTRAQTSSIQNDLTIINSEIKRAELTIKAKRLAIEKLGGDIAKRTGTIGELEAKIEKEKKSLSELLRQVRDAEDESFLEVMLGREKLSEATAELDQIQFVQDGLNTSFAEIRKLKSGAETERTQLSVRRSAEIDAEKAIEEERKLIQRKEAEKKQLLALSKSTESAYQKLLADRQRKAAAIRSSLFALRDTAAIPFGKALEYATAAFKKTGVRPAFLLAILQQESNLGANVGTCNRPGDPPEKSWQKIMPGPAANQLYYALGKSCKNAKTSCSSRDDQTHFIKILSALGRSPDGTPVSCPILSAGPWGGAMGPAQFIPSTWSIFIDRLKTALNVSVPDPWRAEDAFMASAMYLSDLGGVYGSYSGEIGAACRYYGSGGASCTYGTQVMARAADIQLNMIDPLQNL